MKTQNFSAITIAVIAVIIAGSFLYYLGIRRTETILQEPYAILTISRLDNFMPVNMASTFHPVDYLMSKQGCNGCSIFREAINGVNYIYNESANRCGQSGQLENGYCNGVPISAVCSVNLTRNQYEQVVSTIPLQFLNPAKYWSAALYYKNPQCFSYTRGNIPHPTKDGFCYYDLILVKNKITEG